MIQKERNGIIWFEFEQLQSYPHVRHAVFSRSAHDLAHRPETPHNRQIAFDALNMRRTVFPASAGLVHGKNVHHVTSTTPESIDACDALISAAPERALCMSHADCQIAFLYDPRHECIAAVHSGWRSSVHNIYKETIHKLHLMFGSQPDELLVCISPSLGPDKAEFTHFEQELPSSFWKFQTKPTYFDFWQISKWQLESEGIKPAHIEIAGLCTFELKELFFSYRRDKGPERNMSVIWLDR